MTKIHPKCYFLFFFYVSLKNVCNIVFPKSTYCRFIEVDCNIIYFTYFFFLTFNFYFYLLSNLYFHLVLKVFCEE